MLKYFKKNKGFTLIELLVVIAIIAVLASIVLVSLNTARVKGRDARRIADIKSLQVALELYYDSNSNVYPAALSTLAGVQIPAIPKDPKDGTTAYSYSASGSAHTSGTAKAYHLGARLEDAGHSALNTDVDNDNSTANVWTTYFDGNGTGSGNACATSNSTAADDCYDVTN
ncbi:MAG TPA: type II secretion system protein [Candidatus Paceibacterota bacterium]